MSETPRHDDELIERLVRDRHPTVERDVRDRWLFEAGRAAGRRERSGTIRLWATAACLLAVTSVTAWVMRPIVPTVDTPSLAEGDRVESRTPSPERPRAIVRPLNRPGHLRAVDRRLPEWKPSAASAEVATGPPATLVPARARFDVDSI